MDGKYVCLWECITMCNADLGNDHEEEKTSDELGFAKDL